MVFFNVSLVAQCYMQHSAYVAVEVLLLMVPSNAIPGRPHVHFFIERACAASGCSEWCPLLIRDAYLLLKESQ